MRSVVFDEQTLDAIRLFANIALEWFVNLMRDSHVFCEQGRFIEIQITDFAFKLLGRVLLRTTIWIGFSSTASFCFYF